MSKIAQVQSEMMQAMKNKDAERKGALSQLLAALKSKEKDKNEALTAAEEDAVVQREIKQTRETLESAAGRADIIAECEARIKVFMEFAPEEMGEDAVRALINEVLAELGLDAPTPAQKGVVMKALMPKVAGRAPGQLVNKLVLEALGQ